MRIDWRRIYDIKEHASFCGKFTQEISKTKNTHNHFDHQAVDDQED